MAAVAVNAVRNFHLSRAIEVLEELSRMGQANQLHCNRFERRTTMI